jgi:hypothetical protein
VRSELAALLASAQIDQATHDADRAAYAAALASRKRLGGARRVALGAVIENLEDLAARGGLSASRLPAQFETLRRNRQYWTTGPLIPNGRRVSFSGSQLVWQHYAGQGLQIQWLGTFGKANGLFAIGTKDDELRRLLDEALTLAAQRAGGIGFEYLFTFDGGRPPWVSGLAQGTAIQALSRAAVRLAQPRYFEAARTALGVFRTPAPEGVAAPVPGGTHYLIYSFAPRLRVLNAFVQSLNGLHDFAVLANDAEGRALFAAGDEALRREIGAYDTGAWSRYSLQRDSDLSYHKLVRDFLRNLCARMTEDRERPGGGPKPGADPAPYCTTAQRFTAYLTTKPVVRLASARVRAGRPAALRVALSKPGFVSVRVARAGKVVAVLSARLQSGRRSLRWNRPRAAGVYAVTLRATDLAGNDGAATGALRVLRAK